MKFSGPLRSGLSVVLVAASPLSAATFEPLGASPRISPAVTTVLASPLWNTVTLASNPAKPSGVVAEALSAPGAIPADVGAAVLLMRAAHDSSFATAASESLERGGYVTQAAAIRSIARLFGEDSPKRAELARLEAAFHASLAQTPLSDSLAELKSSWDAFFVDSRGRGATDLPISDSAVSADRRSERVAAIAPFDGRIRRELHPLIPRMLGRREGEAPAMNFSVKPLSFPNLYSHYLSIPVPFTKIPILLPIFAGGAVVGGGLSSAFLLSAMWAIGSLLPPTMTMAGKWFSWTASVVGLHSIGHVFIDPALNDAELAGVLAHELTHELRQRGVFKNDSTANGFKALRILERIGSEGLAASLNPAHACFFDKGRTAMKARLQNDSGGNLDRYKSDYNRMFGENKSLFFRIMPEPPWTYFYGTFLGGAAHELALRTRRADDSWKFLRLVSEGLSLEAALRAVLAGSNPPPEEVEKTIGR